MRKNNFTVDLLIRQKTKDIPTTFIKKILQKSLIILKTEIPTEIDELSVVLTNDEDIQLLNKVYRKKNKPTDVLSFPLYTKKELKSKKKILAGSLGDIVISIDTTKRQAKKFKVSIKEELARLLVHGLLHLLGYDHEKVTQNEAQKMRRKEKNLLAQIL